LSKRKEALQSAAYLELKKAYEDRFAAAKEARAAGKRVVGIYGSDVPEEMLIAAGVLPIKVCSDLSVEPKLAPKYIGEADPITASVFDRICDGTYDDAINYLALSNTNASIAAFYSVIRQIRKVFPELRVPPMTFIDFVFTRFMLNQERNFELLTNFKKVLEDWTGLFITEAELMHGIEVCNENRQALREFDALRCADKPTVTASEALVVIGAGFFMDKEKHTALVKAVTEDAKNWPVIDAPRILLFGSDQENTSLYDLISEAGCHIVFEDQDWGARYYDTDVKTNVPLIKGIAARYMNRLPSSSHCYVHERVDLMKKLIEQYKVDGVLFYMNKNDESISWDYPTQKKVLDEMGIPSAVFFSQPVPVKDPEAVKAKLTVLAEAAKGVKANG